ncbi:MAG: gliding motility lipoprotein GldD [Bacteroidales bacterium]|nr:gliding motility lipoprotein GldD [Bacteroidales bacterium]
MKTTKINVLYFIFIILAMLGFGCKKTPQIFPKPYGYFRLQLPQEKWVFIDSIPFFTCSIPNYAYFEKKTSKEPTAFWWDLVFPVFKARVNLSYRPVRGNFPQLAEDARDFVYKHIQKANNIIENPILSYDKKMFGMTYHIEGQTVASPFQFYVSDSTKHYLRGALYFEHVPNNDSISPFIERTIQDIEKIINTLRWKK